MPVQRIPKDKFYKLAPELNAFGFPDREIDWYSTKRGEIIGKLVIDKIEQTWLGHVWIRDATGKYPKREMVGEPYQIKNQTQARGLIEAEMERLLLVNRQEQTRKWWEFWK